MSSSSWTAGGRDDTLVDAVEESRQWLAAPVRKAVCNVSEEEFEKAQGVPDHVVLNGRHAGSSDVETDRRLTGFRNWVE
jgi:hypothetical protein